MQNNKKKYYFNTLKKQLQLNHQTICWLIKKICGILQEIKFNNEVKFIIIGIGVNLTNNPIIKNYPTTNLLKETGIKVKKSKLIKNIEKNYIKNLKLFA